MRTARLPTRCCAIKSQIIMRNSGGSIGMARVVVTGYPHHVTLVLENPEIPRQSKFLILIIDQKKTSG
jgi:hypothetical protein